jgi:uncharacterized protein
MMIVIDTHIFVSACLGNGPSSRVVEGVFEKNLHPLMGAALLSEYEDVLARENLFRTSRLNAQERSTLLDLFLSHCEWQKIYYNWRPNLKDEEDNHLIELAVAGNAEAIVTQNIKDFVGSELYFKNLRILPPVELLKEL